MAVDSTSEFIVAIIVPDNQSLFRLLGIQMPTSTIALQYIYDHNPQVKVIFNQELNKIEQMHKLPEHERLSEHNRYHLTAEPFIADNE